MPRPPSENLTPREAEIMTVLWDRGKATADEVRESLSGDPHDSTVRTLLRVLEAKGYARHSAGGKSYVYRPAMSRDRVESREVRTFLRRLFRGSAQLLVQRLIADDHLSPRELEELGRMPRSGTRKKRKKGAR